MILTCPNCTTRFLLPALTLAPDGRKVRCTNCYEVWFQLPDPEELRARPEDQSDSGDDIPEAVKPQSHSALPAIKEDDEDEGRGKLSRRKIALQSLLVFAVLLAASGGGLFVAKDQLVNQWPQSAALYNLVGIESKMPGEGLVFDKLEAHAGAEGVRVSGMIINLSRVSVGVPMIEVQFRASGQDVLSTAYIQAPLPRVEGEGVLPFEAVLPDHHGASDLLVRFTLGVRVGMTEAVTEVVTESARIDAEDDGNIPAPPASEIDPLNAPAESEESPPPASAAPHQE
ncbi:MAG: zinc-ribbon domain-containing protein [Alphaproteobacteria bacterium]